MDEVKNRILSSKKIAVAGVSSNSRKYGTIVFNNLMARGYEVYPVNPGMEQFNGQKCYSSVTELPDDVKSLVCILKPNTTLDVVKEARSVGITDVWIQPGAESVELIRWCRENGVNAVTKQCIMVQF